MTRQDFRGRENARRRVESVEPDRKEAGHAEEVKVMSLRAAHKLIEMC